MPDSSRPLPVCPICLGDHVMELAGGIESVVIYVCHTCGASLSVPVTGPMVRPPHLQREPAKE